MHDHIEIDLEVFKAQYAASSNAGVGLVVHESGKIKVQVFQEGAMKLMKITMVISVICFLVSVSLVLYSLVMGIILSISFAEAVQ
jgi:hypothetical protein